MNVGFLKARANCYTTLKQYDEALDDLNKAVKFSKINGEVYRQRAELKVIMKDLEGAIRDYDMVEALISDYKMVHYLKGNLYEELGMMDDACFEWSTALEYGVVVAERKAKKHLQSLIYRLRILAHNW